MKKERRKGGTNLVVVEDIRGEVSNNDVGKGREEPGVFFADRKPLFIEDEEVEEEEGALSSAYLLSILSARELEGVISPPLSTCT